MRHGSGNRRNRNRNNNNRRNNNGGSNRSQVFDSNGPDVRIRGTAHQIVEKYSALAKDAKSSGDRTLAENYLQHAEHYQRMIVQWDVEQKERNEAKANSDENMAEKQPAAKKPRKKAAKPTDEELGLPSSILGKAPVEEEAKEKEAESA